MLLLLPMEFVKCFKDTQRQKVSSNKTPVLTESMNMGIRDVGTSNQFFLKKVLKLKQNFQKNKVDTN